MSQSEYELYGWNTPNGQKILIALEEVNISYSYHPIDITQGEQHTTAFKAISPDGKIPALIHHSASPIRLFESGAILLYLAEQFPILHGANKPNRALVTAWTFWQVGQLGPLTGQLGRFKGMDNADQASIDHFEKLVWRCLSVLEKRLTQSSYLVGDRFSVADIASLPWIISPQSYLQKFGLSWREKCPALKQWGDQLIRRPSVIKALGL